MAGQMDTKIQHAQIVIGYVFNDPLILWEALNVAGSNVTRAGNRIFIDGNKRLALLGDTVLKTALIDTWYPSGEPRARAQDRIDSIAANINLATVGFNYGLGNAVNKNPSQQGAISNITMATTVEAIFGAVYEDGHKDLVMVKRVMHTLGL